MFAILLDSELDRLATSPICASCGCYIGGWVARNYDNNSLHCWDKCIAPFLLDEDIQCTVEYYQNRLGKERARWEALAWEAQA